MSIRIITGDWEAMKERARPIRHDVFVREQQVPVELEWDEMDAPSLHALALDAEGKAIGTARLLPDGHIGRMAVLKEARGRGVGSALLAALMQAARQQGVNEVVLSAQRHAESFYRRHGFEPYGAEYAEAGIPHIEMRCRLG
ncbi:Predicted N-acyltransferase, GNAT family [Noviherbaspirillum humi]|uniref:Predicted N-acyltransferase, GNAT family n=1 Tax=Noviherbaspirillum humi TaxID=1688639 RepID=A0A239HAT8_9BURK|nr:GNAT family N-acetyltransferase [Noviherbaspirillum humi]SNS78392.1 Predicted N-acyltransferase, GNAT family [Noviherbaspirillum humi]